MGISGDHLSSRIFWRNYRFENTVTQSILRKTHALLSLAHAVSPLHSKFITNFMTSRTLHSSRALLSLAHAVSPLHSTCGGYLAYIKCAHSYVGHGTLICGTYRIQMRDITHNRRVSEAIHLWGGYD